MNRAGLVERIGVLERMVVRWAATRGSPRKEEVAAEKDLLKEASRIEKEQKKDKTCLET